MPDLTKVQAKLEWQPVVGLDEILRRTVAYYYDLYGSD